MNQTERLYYEDAYLLEFDAEVIERREHESAPAVILDRTAFYPESGGQPWDEGTLDGVEVVKVLDLDGTILHVLAAGVPGPKVHGRIDRGVRFDHMQQHTGQHILSQAFFEVLRGETLGFHLGKDVSTLEIGLAAISEESLARVEDRANAVVWEDREVKTYFVPEERIAEVPLRRPPKKTGLLRVVEVDGFDYSACGGTHTRRSGEVGLIKVGSAEKIRGHLRFDFACGGRALTAYRSADGEVRRVAGVFSSSGRAVAAQVEKLAAEFKTLKKRARRLEERLAAFEAREVIGRAPGKIIAEVLEDKSGEEARFLALNIVKSGEFAVVYGVREESLGRLVFARTGSIAVDLRGLVPVIGGVLQVKGGGGPSLVELVTPEKDKLDAAVAAARAWLETHDERLKGTGERAKS